MNVIWSSLAKEYYINIIEQLFEKWNVVIVEDFDSDLNKLIKNISNFNHICPKSKIINLHKCIVNKNISLIYRIQNESIEIVTLLFNKSNHLY